MVLCDGIGGKICNCGAMLFLAILGLFWEWNKRNTVSSKSYQYVPGPQDFPVVFWCQELSLLDLKLNFTTNLKHLEEKNEHNQHQSKTAQNPIKNSRPTWTPHDTKIPCTKNSLKTSAPLGPSKKNRTNPYHNSPIPTCNRTNDSI
jgi:hypothetical protein